MKIWTELNYRATNTSFPWLPRKALLFAILPMKRKIAIHFNMEVTNA